MQSEDITTAVGQVLKDAMITRKDAIGVIISHIDADTKVNYSKLFTTFFLIAKQSWPCDLYNYFRDSKPDK